MIEIKDKSKCCGCTACYSVCSQNAIEMIEDEEGFKYPLLKLDKCVNCGLCVQICPILKEKNVGIGISEKYAVQYKDEKARAQSTAGGFFSVVADWIIEEKKGVVFAAGYEGYTVVHKAATAKSSLEEMRGSKYVQSDLRNVFREIQIILKQNQDCLFVGTPCQVYGLSNYISNSDLRQHLILIDLLCLGVSSPYLYEKWVKYLERKYKDTVKTVRFRDKSYGYATANIKVIFQKRNCLEQRYDAKSLMKTFFSGYNMRPSCYDCVFRCVDRASDFTIGDFHQIREFSAKMDDDKGTTCVWVHTDKAKKLMSSFYDRITYLCLEPFCSSTLDVISKKTEIPINRDAFFSDIKKLSYNEFVKKWAKNDLKSIIANIVKPIINKTPCRTIIFKMIKKKKQRSFQKRVEKANDRK